MAKKKVPTSDSIVELYMDYILEHDSKPSSVYKFAKDASFEEKEFYQFFSSFEGLEKQIFTEFLAKTLEMLHQSDEYVSSDARNKLLSFYYTFFELLTANRSYVVTSLNKSGSPLEKMKKLSDLRIHFQEYIDALGIESIDLKHEKANKYKQNTISEIAWAQLLFTLKFWLNDTSPSFEKTDVLIEKSVNTSFDLVDVQPMKSLFDLGKFIYKEARGIK